MQDDDIERLATAVTTVFNLEMACTDEMLAIAERTMTKDDLADLLRRLPKAT